MKFTIPLPLAAFALVGLLLTGPVLSAGEELVVYKDPNCGCCGAWATHMREHGFAVREVATQEMGLVKSEAGVPRALGSCHTATVGGYVIEGHVPADDVRRLLDEKPALAGLAVPGMPQGSPGMEGPYPPQRYEVIGFDGKGGTKVYARH
tara:strand:- start:1022 stop:1471 length:450 start_codon:yes stop_codon:yes gene_type:complete